VNFAEHSGRTSGSTAPLRRRLGEAWQSHEIAQKSIQLIGLGILLGAVLALVEGCSQRPVEPRQPIAFSHRIHAGDYKIDCQYCHDGVRRPGAAAGVPSVQLCMGCHKLVSPTKPEVVKIRQAFETRQPIRWMRVVDLPDFVFFNHNPHIAKGITCQQCHGPVETMDEVRMVNNLNNMDTCVTCHRKNQASIDCYVCHR
jgi:hypothetical protein